MSLPKPVLLVVKKGQDIVPNVTNNMSVISEYSDKTNQSMHILKERSVEISRVLGVISTSPTRPIY